MNAHDILNDESIPSTDIPQDKPSSNRKSGDDWTPPDHLYPAMDYNKERADRVRAFIAKSTLPLNDSAKANLARILDLLDSKFYKFRYLCTDDKRNDDTINNSIKNYYKGNVEVFTLNKNSCKASKDDNVIAVHIGDGKSNDIYKYLRSFNSNKYEDWKPGRRWIEAIKLRVMLGEDMFSLPKLFLVYTEDGVEDPKVWSKNKDWSKAGWVTNEMYIASKLDIPIVNIYNDDSVERVRELLN